MADDETQSLDGDSHEGEPPIGAHIGRFSVEGSLGMGGMGVVLAAHDPTLDRKVAIKILRGFDGPEARDRLSREAQAMARLQHPNVATVYEVGRYGDKQFVAMELVDGQTLKGWLRERPRTAAEVVRMMVAAGRGLEAVHGAGLVHRDFKPDNVLVGKDGRPRVTDFGLVSLRGPERAGGAAGQTRSSAGTPAYMSPEQVRGEPADARSDQFSYCVTLFEGLYGERPFSDDAAPEARRAPPRPRKNVPARLYTIVARGLRAEPSARFASMGELLAALEHDPSRRTRRIGFVALVAVLAAVTLGWWQSQHRAGRRVERARALGQEAQQARAMMRASHMMPLHDVKADRDRVRALMERVRSQMGELGEDGRGLAEFALGAGHFAIGEKNEAKQHLQAAWDAGERNPDVAFELGQLLALELEIKSRSLSPDPETRKKEKAELDRTLREPAIACLRQAVGAADSSPEFIEALIAFADFRSDEAIGRGEAALREQPTLYEAGLLVAGSYSRQATAARRAGEAARADALVEKSLDLYAKMIDIARSDEKIYRQYADNLGISAWNQFQSDGKDVSPLFDRVIALTQKGQEADSEAYWPDEYAARTYSMWTEVDYRQKRDPRPRIQATIAAAERELKRQPKAAGAYEYIGNAWGAMVDRWEEQHGLDPRDSLQKSIDAYDACIRIKPTPDCYGNAGTSRDALARWQMAHGADATSTVEASLRNREDALVSFPDMVATHSDICSFLAEVARDRLANGVDPTSLLDRAAPHCQVARKTDAGVADALDGLGCYELARGWREARAARDPLRDWQDAERDLQSALKLQPNRDDLRVDLVELLLLRARALAAGGQDFERDLSRAVDEARRAVKDNAESALAHRSLARAQLAAARLQHHSAPTDAIANARRALEIKRDDIGSMVVLLELEWLGGKRDPDLLEKARAMNPHHPRLAAIAEAYARSLPLADPI